MKLENLKWDKGCCAAQAQFSSGDKVVAVAFTYEPGTYRIEVYKNNVLEFDRHDLTTEEIETALAIFE